MAICFSNWLPKICRRAQSGPKHLSEDGAQAYTNFDEIARSWVKRMLEQNLETTPELANITVTVHNEANIFDVSAQNSSLELAETTVAVVRVNIR